MKVKVGDKVRLKSGTEGRVTKDATQVGNNRFQMDDRYTEFESDVEEILEHTKP